MYLVFLFFKYKYNKTGTYNVHKRHSEQQQQQGSGLMRIRESSSLESGTSSAHSSFRDISQLYNHDRVRDCLVQAELGSATNINVGSGNNALAQAEDRNSRTDTPEV